WSCAALISMPRWRASRGLAISIRCRATSGSGWGGSESYEGRQLRRRRRTVERPPCPAGRPPSSRLGAIIATSPPISRQPPWLAPDDAAVAARAAELEQRPPAVGEPPPDPTLPPELSLLEEATLNTPGRTRVTGIIDRFFTEKGFGFLRYGDGQTLFFHITQCE